MAEDKIERFEQSVLPHMDAAYNLARWLTRDDHDAQDVVQEACLRAFRFFDGFRGGDGRAWLLKIVRNTFYTWVQENRREETAVNLDENAPFAGNEENLPEAVLLRQAGEESLRQAIDGLPLEFRETLVLRELEGLSYKEIAALEDVPLGTVMSRLARARQLLRKRLIGP